MARRMISEFAWVLLGKVVAFVSSMLLVRYLTHAMLLNQYAELMLGLTIFNFFTQILMGALGQGVGRIYVQAIGMGEYFRFKKSAKKLFRDALIVYLVIMIGCFLGLFFDVDHDLLLLLALLSLYSFIYGINDIATGVQNLARNRRETAYVTILEQFVKVFGIVLISKCMAIDAKKVIGIYILATLTALCYQRMVQGKIGQATVCENTCVEICWRERIMQIAAPASFWGVFVWLQQASDKWALKLFVGSDSVAQYGVLYQVAYAPFLMGMGVVMTLFTPMIYANKGAEKIIVKLLWFLLFSVIISVCLALFFGNAILSSIVDNRYTAMAHLMPYMIVAAGFYQAGDVVSSHLMRNIQPNVMMVIKMFSSVFCLVSNFIAAYFFGLFGVVVSMILFGLVYFLCFSCYSFSKRDNGLSPASS